MFTPGLLNKVKSYALLVRRFSSKFTEQKVDIGGVNINYVRVGDGPKSVLLMPGSLGSAWTDFTHQIEKLPQMLPDYTLIAWDPPGYGKSIPPKREFGLDYLRRDAEDAKKLMQVLGFPKFSVLGWSDGGITGLIMSGTHPSPVKKLVIWGVGAYINEKELDSLKDLRDVKKWSKNMREPMEKLYGRERFAELWSEWVDAQVALYEHRHGNYCRKEVNQIRIPTLILHGKKDPMIAEEHIPNIRKRILGSRYYEFRDGKHNIHMKYADEFNRVVVNFLLDTY